MKDVLLSEAQSRLEVAFRIPLENWLVVVIFCISAAFLVRCLVIYYSE